VHLNHGLGCTPGLAYRSNKKSPLMFSTDAQVGRMLETMAENHRHSKDIGDNKNYGKKF
jgi:hypothetical protein